MNNQKRANITLLFLSMAFIISLTLTILNPDNMALKFLNFTIEASVIGGFVDWFAVTAIFREHRVGKFKIWHTGIIPNKRRQVIEGIRQIVETELISMSSIKTQLQKGSLTQTLIQLIENNITKEQVRPVVEKWLKATIKQLDVKALARFLESKIKIQLQQLQLAPLAYSFAKKSSHNGQINQWMDAIILELIRIIKKEEVKALIYRTLLQKKEDYINQQKEPARTTMRILSAAINLENAAEEFHQEIGKMADSLLDQKDPIRSKLNGLVQSIIHRLDSDPNYIHTLESWKNGVLSNVQTTFILEAIIEEVFELATIPARERTKPVLDQTTLLLLDAPSILMDGNHSILLQWAEQQIELLWGKFKQEPTFQKAIEPILKNIVLLVIEKEHNQIGNFVKEVLEGLTDEEISTLINAHFGEDLHYIRINGSMIGAAMGAVMFVVFHYLIPMI